MKTYKEGLIDGIKMYSWMKDGVSYVGTTGKTLKKAIEEIEAEFRPGITCGSCGGKFTEEEIIRKKLSGATICKVCFAEGKEPD